MNDARPAPTPTEPSTSVAPARRSRRDHAWRSRWAAVGAAVAVATGAGGIVHFVDAASSAPSAFVSITPVRILDTRDPVNVGLAGPFVSAVSQDLKVTGNVPTTTGPQVVVPDGATSVVLNVTVVAPAADGFVSVRPADTAGAPATSSLNFEAGETTPNAVTVALPTAGADAGTIDITYDAYGVAGPTTDILVDVVGYTTAVDAYTKAESDARFGNLFAVVESDGTLVRGSGAVSAQLLAGVPDGRYAVVFDRDISGCAYTASSGRPSVNTGPQIGFAMVANWDGNPTNGVAVFVKDQDGGGADRGFHLTVTC